MEWFITPIRRRRSSSPQTTKPLPGTLMVGRMSREAWRHSLVHLSTSGQTSVLILTRNEVIDRLNELIVVPATRTVRGLETEVELGLADGMPVVCALNF